MLAVGSGMSRRPLARAAATSPRQPAMLASRSCLPGLVFTMVWGLELPEDRTLVSSYVDLVTAAGGRVTFVELYAELAERLDRNRTELRLAEKRSKRDLEFSHGNVLELESYVMNSRPGVGTEATAVLDGHPHLRIDNTRLSAAEVADQVVTAF